MLAKGLQLGHYRLLQPIGSGGMGEVYLAEDTRIARQVAIKVVRTEPVPYPDEKAIQEATRLFQREMRAISMLDHPNILHLIDFGEETIDNAPLTYMIMPYRQEGSLADWLSKRSEKLSLDDVAHFITQAADALQHAHDHRLIHQDVKPPNFLLRNRQNNPNRPDVLLTDFGVAKLSTATATASQSVRGTPTFMAPEQWEGQPEPATDQYALAVMAYQLLTGRTPFIGRMEQVMRQHFITTPQRPGAYNPNIPPALDAVILRALAKKPEERFPSISDFAQAFQQAIHQTGTGELRTTLTISKIEALNGVERTITLPGRRRITVTVPKDAQEGQIIRIEGQGEEYFEGGPRGPLVLTIAISQRDTQSASAAGEGEQKKAVLPSTASAPLPPPTSPSNATDIPASNPSNPRLEPTVAVPPPDMPKLEPTVAAPPPEPLKIPNVTSSTTEQKNEVSPLVPTVNRSTATTKKPRRTRTILLVVLAIVVAISGLISIGTYQSHVNSVNATATADAEYEAANATATADVITKNPDPYPPSGTLALYDPLSSSSAWSSDSDSNWGGACSFTDGAYHISQSKPNRNYLCTVDSDFSNFAFEVLMAIIRGDCGGIILRADTSSGKNYKFIICQSSYEFYVYTSFSDSRLLKRDSLSLDNTQNKIAAVANGSVIDLYINNQKVDSVNDSSYSHGKIGMIASATNNSTEVAYSDAKVWKL